MNKEVINKLDEITDIIKSDKELIEMKKLEKELTNDKELMKDINKLKEIPSYGEEYLELKEKILSNSKFKRYKELEKDLYLFTKDINKKLDCFKEKSGCR